MDYFPYRSDQLFAEEVAVNDIAEQYGTPCYVYSRAAIEAAFTEYTDSLEGSDHLICYAVKANSNIVRLSRKASKTHRPLLLACSMARTSGSRWCPLPRRLR